MEINLTIPESWGDLSQSQLDFLLKTIVNVQRLKNNERFRSQADFSAQTISSIATYCLCRWSGLTIVTPYGEGFLIRYRDTTFHISAEQMASTLSVFDWIKNIPQNPVRLESVCGADAVSADLSGFPFESYLSCENLWQGYQTTHDPELLRQMAELLYGQEGIMPQEHELLGVFYWWASVKIMFSSIFPHFFRPVDSTGEAASPDYNTLRRNVDAQIRALTKGDVTKEPQVLSLDCWRALTELDAQAREYEELNKRFNKSTQ